MQTVDEQPVLSRGNVLTLSFSITLCLMTFILGDACLSSGVSTDANEMF